MANDHQVTIGHLSFTSPQSLSHSAMDGTRDLTISGILAHTNATGLDVEEVYLVYDRTGH
jgi:hypothetical protein